MLGILSDAHGNLEAFDRGIHILRSLGVKKFIFLGDAVGYLPGTGVVDRIFELREQFTCVQGNHEEMLTSHHWSSERDQIYKHSETRKTLTKENLEFLKSWEISYQMSTNSGASFFVHGGPQDPLNQCIYPDSCLEDISADHSFLFMGHTHRPFIRRNGTRTFVNVGSCGLPRDNGVLGSFCLFDEINGLVDIIRYDISNIARKIDSRHDVHNDVKDIFKRKSTGYCGTLIEQYDRGVS